jgi:hypothetical protein
MYQTTVLTIKMMKPCPGQIKEQTPTPKGGERGRQGKTIKVGPFGKTHISKTQQSVTLLKTQIKSTQQSGPLSIPFHPSALP